ncbi:hypothetical protein LTR08_005923 [Meristemomyces frigidus]|nr:hypothetical protein LTR08_005923 [Meristemomyces frigidus]
MMKESEFDWSGPVVELKSADGTMFNVHKALASKLSWGDDCEALEDYLDKKWIHKLAVGLLQARFQSAEQIPVPPYIADPSQYHRHTALGLPCYKKS